MNRFPLGEFQEVVLLLRFGYMLKHSMLITYRNARRHKSTFVINLVGLSIGLACVMLISLWVHDELNFDKFNENDDRLFQVWQNVPRGSGSILTTQATPAVLAQVLMNEFPEVENATLSMGHRSGLEGIVATDCDLRLGIICCYCRIVLCGNCCDRGRLPRVACYSFS